MRLVLVSSGDQDALLVLGEISLADWRVMAIDGQ